MMVANMLEGIEVELGVDYLEKKEYYDSLGEKKSYIPDRSMHILPMNWVHWNTVRYDSRQRYWTNRISREMQL